MMVSTIDRMGHEARAALAEATARLIVLCQEQIEQARVPTTAEVWERDRARWVDLWAKPGVTFD